MRTQLILLIALSSPAFAQGSNIPLSDLGLRLADLKGELKIYDDAVKERDQFDKDMDTYDARLDQIKSTAYAAYVANCPEGFPPEQAQSCAAQYAAVRSQWDPVKAQYEAAKAQSADANARINASIAKMKPVAAILWTAFPECRTVTPIENSATCLQQSFDAAKQKGAIAAAPQGGNAASQNGIQLNPGAIAGGQTVKNGAPPIGGAPRGDTTLQRLQSMGRGQVSLGSGFENRDDKVVAIPPKGATAAPSASATRSVSPAVAADPGYRAAEQARASAAKDEAAAEARINQLKAKQATEDSNQRQLDQIEISRQEQARQAAKSAERTAEIRRDAAQKRVEAGAPEIVPAPTARRN